MILVGEAPRKACHQASLKVKITLLLLFIAHSGADHWTGLHYDGHIFAWDGFEPIQNDNYVFPGYSECER